MEKSDIKVESQQKISKDVISTVVKNAVLGMDNVYGITPAKAKRIIKIFDSNTNPDAIDIIFSGDTVEIDICILVKPSTKVKALCEQVQEKVKFEVQSMTGVTVSKVNVTVSDVIYN